MDQRIASLETRVWYTRYRYLNQTRTLDGVTICFCSVTDRGYLFQIVWPRRLSDLANWKEAEFGAAIYSVGMYRTGWMNDIEPIGTGTPTTVLL